MLFFSKQEGGWKEEEESVKKKGKGLFVVNGESIASIEELLAQPSERVDSLCQREEEGGVLEEKALKKGKGLHTIF